MTREPASPPRLSADFWRICSASVIAKLGSGITSTAVPLLAASLTRDPRAVSLVSVFGGLPWLLFALHTGALADRWNRRTAMWGCDLASALAVGALAVVVATGHPTLGALCLVEFVMATISTLFDSASQSMLPSVVPTGQLAQANSRMYTGSVLAGLFVGPPLGSLVYAQSHSLPFALEAVGFIASAALIFALRTAAGRRPARADRGSVSSEIAEGIRWLWNHRQLRALVALLTVWNLMETAYLAVLVLYVLETLQVDASLYGVLLTGVAVGGITGATVAPRLNRKIGTGSVIALTLILTVIATLGLAVTRTPLIAVGLLAVIGFAAFAFNVVSATYRQSAVPDALQGRVNSAYRFATWGVAPIGAALGGLIAHTFGLPAVFLIAAVVLAAIGALTLPLLTNARLAVPADAILR